MAPDPVWKFATRIGTRKFKCSFWKGIFFGTAQRLKFHLAQARYRNIRVCSEVSAEAKNRCLDWLQEKSASASHGDRAPQALCTSSIVSEINDGATGLVVEASKSAPKREEMVQLCCVDVASSGSQGRGDMPDGPMEVKESIIRFLRLHCLPLETVDDPTFIDMYCTIVQFGSTGLPSPKDLHEMEGFMDDDDDDDENENWDL